MQKTLPAELTKLSKDKVKLEITKENYEAFCSAVGFFKQDFIETLNKSEADHRSGRITRRKSLFEITDKA